MHLVEIQWYFGKIQKYFFFNLLALDRVISGENTLVFGAKTLVFRVNIVVFVANTLVFRKIQR